MSAFLVLAFAWTAFYDVVGGHALGLHKTPVGTLPRDIGPVAAALVVLSATGNRGSIRHLAKSLIAWRLPLRWYGVTLIGIPVTYLVGVLVIVRPGAPTAPPWELLALYPLLIVAAAVIGGPLLEEPGWRGFLLPMLQRQISPLLAALIVGLVWATWHATGYVDDGFAASNGGRGLPAIATFAGAAVAASVVIAWVYNSTRGSLLMAVLAHNSVNITQAIAADIWPGVRTEGAALASLAAMAFILALVTRGHLGHVAEQSTLAADLQNGNHDDSARD